MSGKIILRIVKIILQIMKTILRIVVLGTGFTERSRKVPSRHLTLHVYEPISGQDTGAVSK